MLKKLLTLFRRLPVTVAETARIEEGTAKTATFGDASAGAATHILLARVDGKLHALDAVCPHEMGRLEPGKLKPGNLAICAVHGYLFDVKDGSVKRGHCRKAKVYRVDETNGQATIWV